MCILTSYRKNCDSFQQFRYIHSLILWNACPLQAPVGGYGKGRNSRQKSRVISQWLEYSKFGLTSKRYFKNAKKTAPITSTKATMWFHWRVSVRNMVMAMVVNTVSEMASWIIFSCIRL